MKRLFIPILIAFAIPCHSQWRNGYMKEPILAFGTHDTSLFIGMNPPNPQDPLVWRLISLAPNVVWRYADTGLVRNGGNITLFASLGKYLFCDSRVNRLENNAWKALNAGGPFGTNGRYLFAQYYPDSYHVVVLRSRDTGGSWDSVWNIPTTSFASNSANFSAIGNCIFANLNGDKGHFLWRSLDTGGTWSELQVPPFAESYGNNTLLPMGSLLFLIGDGELAESTDSGSHWSVIPVDSAGAPETVNCLATDGKNLFAGTQAGVLVSTDIGQHWQAKNDGLTYVDDFNGDTISVRNISTMAVFDTFLFIEVSKISLNNLFSAYYRPLSELTGPPDVVQLPPPNDTIEIYPNPASGMVSIRSGGTSILGITVLNVLGENMLSIPSSHSSDVSLDLSKLPSGTYFLQIETQNGIVLRKVIRE